MLNITYRFGTGKDLDLLAQWNYQLIQDEGHRNSLSLSQLRDRMKAWLQGEYKAVIFESDQIPIAYALYREGPDEIYLRHLFVNRGNRRKGIGHRCVDILRLKLWPTYKRLTVESLVKNGAVSQFWHSAGFTDYSLTLEIMPEIMNIQGSNVDAILKNHS